MPWTSADSKRFSKKASGNRNFSKQWSSVANSVLAKTGDDGAAIKAANGVIAKRASKDLDSTPPKMSGNKGV